MMIRRGLLIHPPTTILRPIASLNFSKHLQSWHHHSRAFSSLRSFSQVVEDKQSLVKETHNQQLLQHNKNNNNHSNNVEKYGDMDLTELLREAELQLNQENASAEQVAPVLHVLGEKIRHDKTLRLNDFRQVVDFSQKYKIMTFVNELLIKSCRLLNESDANQLQTDLVTKLFEPNIGEVEPVQYLFPVIRFALMTRRGSRAKLLYNHWKRCQPGVALTTEQYLTLIESAVKHRLTELINLFISEAERQENLTAKDYQFITLGLLNTNMISKAMIYFRKITKQATVDSPVLVVLLDKLSKPTNLNKQYIDEVLQYLETTAIPLNDRIFQSIFNVLGQKEDFSAGFYWLNRYLKSGIVFNPNSIDGFIRSFAECEKINEALIIIRHIAESTSISPTVRSYALLLNYCKSMDDIQKVLEDMQERKVFHNAVSLNSLIKCFLKLNNVEEAFKIYENMKNGANPRTKPDAFTYSSLLVAFKDDTTKANQLYNECVALNINRTNLLMCRFIQASDLYRNQLINQVLKSRRQDLQEIEMNYPDLLPTLLAIVPEQDRIRLQSVLENHGMRIIPLIKSFVKLH